MKLLLCICFLAMVLFSNAQQNQLNNYSLANLAIQWEVVENYHKGKTEVLSAFTITNKSGSFPAKGWKLYFNFPRMINPSSVTGGMKIEHINGDFYQLSPSANFKGLSANHS